MKIIVCVKQVPDTTEVRIDPKTNNLVRAGVPSILNPSDKTAVAAALDIKKQTDAEVTVVSMGPMQAAAELEKCLSWGADRAVLLSDRRFVGADTLATSGTLAAFIEKENCDLILCGAEAIDGSTGQVGPGIAEHLGIPAVTYAAMIKILEDTAMIDRNAGAYIDTYQVKLPCVACMIRKDVELQEEEASKKQVEIVTADGFDEEKIGSAGSPTKVVSIKYGKGSGDYIWVDPTWDLDRRMEHIFNGGFEPKDYELIRGEASDIAHLLDDEIKKKGEASL